MGVPLRAGKKGKATSAETLSDCIQVGWGFEAFTAVAIDVCMLVRSNRYCLVLCGASYLPVVSMMNGSSTMG